MAELRVAVAVLFSGLSCLAQIGKPDPNVRKIVAEVSTQRISAFLAEQIPGATLQVVDDANHLLPVTHQARLGSFLLEQLAE